MRTHFHLEGTMISILMNTINVPNVEKP